MYIAVIKFHPDWEITLKLRLGRGGEGRGGRLHPGGSTQCYVNCSGSVHQWKDRVSKWEAPGLVWRKPSNKPSLDMPIPLTS